MQLDEQTLFGSHTRALRLFTQRNEVLSNNLVNADTPGFKARDIDFKAELGRTRALSVEMSRTDTRHIGAAGPNGEADRLYRVPLQPAMDGNSVEADVEQANFAENSMRYQATLMFLSGRIRSLKSAISGGQV